MSSQMEDAFNEALERRAAEYEQRIGALRGEVNDLRDQVQMYEEKAERDWRDFGEMQDARIAADDRVAALDDLVQRAWSLIAGAMSGNPHKPTANSEWMDAARRWEIDGLWRAITPPHRNGSAQHGPAGTVVYGRAVPSGGPIPDSEFGVTSTVLDPKTGIAEPVTTGRIPDAEFVEPPLMPPAASPDSPDDRESLIAAEFFAAGMRAASPDERLREALARANDDLILIADEAPEDIGESIDSVRAAIKDALAADREENTDG